MAVAAVTIQTVELKEERIAEHRYAHRSELLSAAFQTSGIGEAGRRAHRHQHPQQSSAS
jgi:hypothetical protein